MSLYSLLLETIPYSDILAVLESKPNDIVFKSEYDFVTDTDLTLERLLFQAIKMHFKDAFILSEESQEPDLLVHNASDYWLLDPLDGTHNFTYGLPYYGLQLCHFIKGEVAFSLIYLPKLGELYSYEKDHSPSIYKINSAGALHLAKEETFKSLKPQSYYSFGDFSNSNRQSRYLQGQLMTQLGQGVSKIRIHGASSVDFAFLCSGRTQAHFIFSNRPWEILPGVSLCKGFGLSYKVYDLDTAFYKGPLHVIARPEELRFIEDFLKL